MWSNYGAGCCNQGCGQKHCEKSCQNPYKETCMKKEIKCCEKVSECDNMHKNNSYWM